MDIVLSPPLPFPASMETLGVDIVVVVVEVVVIVVVRFMKNLPAMCSHRTQPSSPQSCVWPLDPRMKAGTATLIIYVF